MGVGARGLACYGWVNEEFGRGEWMCLYTSTRRHGNAKKLSCTTTGWPMFVRLGVFKRSKIKTFNFLRGN